MSNDPIRRIDEALHAAHEDLRRLDGESITLAASITDPADPRWAEFDDAVSAAKQAIRRLEAMRVAACKHAGAEALKEHMAEREAAAKRAIRIAKDRVKLAKQLDEAIAHVGDLLAQWKAASLDCHHAAMFVHRDDNRPGFDYAFTGATLGNSARFSAALHWQLFQAGIGRDYLPIEQPLMVRQIGEAFGFADAAEHAAHYVEDRVQRSLVAFKPAEAEA